MKSEAEALFQNKPLYFYTKQNTNFLLLNKTIV